VFLGPSLLVLIGVTVLPLVFLVATSLTPLDMSNPASLRWAGIINKASKNKNAGWEFIKWAVSKDVMPGAALDQGHLACTRACVPWSPASRRS